MRSKLENEYLAASLRGHIQYYATSYSKSPDHEGRAAIRFDGKEIIAGCYYNNWLKAELFPRDARYERRMKEEMAFTDDTVCSSGSLISGAFTRPFQSLTIRALKRAYQAKICWSAFSRFWTAG